MKDFELKVVDCDNHYIELHIHGRFLTSWFNKSFEETIANKDYHMIERMIEKLMKQARKLDQKKF